MLRSNSPQRAIFFSLNKSVEKENSSCRRYLSSLNAGFHSLLASQEWVCEMLHEHACHTEGSTQTSVWHPSQTAAAFSTAFGKMTISVQESVLL